MPQAARLTQEITEEYIRLGYWDIHTLPDYWERNARDFTEWEALVDSRTRLTWGDAALWMDRLALGLVELGLKRDELLVAQLPNCVELFVLRAACEKAGILSLPAVRTLRHKEIAYILKCCEAVGIVIPFKFRNFDYFQMVQEIRVDLPRLRYVIVTGEEIPSGAISFKEMTRQPLEKKYPVSYLNERKFHATEFSLVVHTTGSTGFPKFVEVPICSRLYAARERMEGYGINKDDVIALFAPTAIGPNVIAYFAAPQIGAKVVMLEAFEVEDALRLIEKEKVSFAATVPAILSLLIRHPNFQKYNLSSLRLVSCDGAPLPYELGLEAEEKLKCPVVQGYGAMDFGGLTRCSPSDPRELRLQSVGKPCAGNEIRLVDNQGKEVSRGEVGEIWGRGATSVSAYYKDPETTKRVWTEDGWFKTGDLGRVDDSGNLWIVGREKDMIIRGGQNVYPVEIENILITHPKVVSVAIVGMPDKTMGEKACAYIVPKPGNTLTFEEVTSFLKRQQIAPYKLPERLELVSSLPTVGEHKVDKKALRQNILEKLKAEGKG